ncbi:MAG: hypothetical protein ACE5JR_12445 [Gemmatimonadota bacterium]
MRFRPLDTTADALQAQRSALSKLDPEARVRAALEMSDSTRGLRLAGLRSRHPEASERELVARFIAEAYGVWLDPTG